MKHLLANWQKFLFAAFGFIPLYYCISFLTQGKITEAAASFGIGFLSFLYANLSQFKRFKGLGFEAELWEDKQKEAEALISRLKNVVSIYTHQIVRNNILRGRWVDDEGWEDTWKLFSDLSKQHDVLGQKIDFSELKRFADDYFLFDICQNNVGACLAVISNAKNKAADQIKIEFGSPVIDIAGFQKKNEILANIKTGLDDEPLDISKKSNLAKSYIELLAKSSRTLKSEFGIEVIFPEDKINVLNKISDIYNNRPVVVSKELISLSRSRAR